MGGNFDGGYGQQQNAGYYPQGGQGGPGILTGPVPSWVPQGPFKNFDKCKCTERFNCPSPGISYVSLAKQKENVSARAENFILRQTNTFIRLDVEK